MIICIAREFGSGGYAIGKRLAEHFDMSFYDKNLLEIAARQSGIVADFFEKTDEKLSQPLGGGMFGLRFPFAGSMATEDNFGAEKLFRIQSETIRRLAEYAPCVFVGRCANYILRDRTDCINLFISADMQDRISRVAKRTGLDEQAAAALTEKTDKCRAAYYNFYTSKTWGNSKDYHLCINSSLLGIEGSCNQIISFVQAWQDKGTCAF